MLMQAHYGLRVAVGKSLRSLPSKSSILFVSERPS